MSAYLPPTVLRGRLGDPSATPAGLLANAPAPVMRERPREYAVLTGTIARAGRTPCAGDNRFTTDLPRSLTAVDVAEMRAMCAGCAARAACDAFANAALPPVGFWAGRQHPLPKDTTA